MFTFDNNIANSTIMFLRKWHRLILNLSFLLIFSYFYFFLILKHENSKRNFDHLRRSLISENINSAPNSRINNSTIKTNIDDDKNEIHDEINKENEIHDEINKDIDIELKAFWMNQYKYSPLIDIERSKSKLKKAIGQGLKLSENSTEEYFHSLEASNHLDKLFPNHNSLDNHCDPRIYELVESVLAPFKRQQKKTRADSMEKKENEIASENENKKDEEGGITRHQIETAIFPFDDPSIPTRQFVVQVIDETVWIDFSGALHSVWFEWQRATFIFEILVEWINVMKSFNRPIPDFEFVLETKDCPFIGARKDLNDSMILDAWETRRKLPIMSVFKCKHTNLIPVVQWLYFRDGLFKLWDLKWWNLFVNCNHRSSTIPFENRINKAVFRGIFSPYSSFNEFGESIPTRITNENLNMTGRAYLHLLGMNNTDYLDIDVVEYWLYKKIIQDSIFANTTHQTDKKIQMIDQLNKYQFAISAEGWCGWADRVRYLLHANAVILQQETNCGEYYQAFLKPWEHYIPVSINYRDLIDKVKWARENTDQAKKIAENGKRVAQELLTRESIKCYQFILFEKYANLMRYKPKRRVNSVKWTRDMSSYIKRESNVGWKPNPQYMKKFNLEK